MFPGQRISNQDLQGELSSNRETPTLSGRDEISPPKGAMEEAFTSVVYDDGIDEWVSNNGQLKPTQLSFTRESVVGRASRGVGLFEDNQDKTNISHDDAESEIVYETESVEHGSPRDPSVVDTQSGAGSPRKTHMINTDSKYDVPDEDDSSTPDQSMQVVDMSEIRKSQEESVLRTSDEKRPSRSIHMFPASSPVVEQAPGSPEGSNRKSYNDQEKSQIVDFLLKDMKQSKKKSLAMRKSPQVDKRSSLIRNTNETWNHTHVSGLEASREPFQIKAGEDGIPESRNTKRS